MRLLLPQRKGARALVVVPALAAAGLVALATDGAERPRSVEARASLAAPPAGAALRASTPAARVTVARPRAGAGGTTLLRARVRGARERIVAVTFELDGRPLGTDTTAPYAFDVDPSALPARGALRAVAIDRIGRRAASARVRVRFRRARAGAVIAASPGNGVTRALDALGRGHVTVRLGPGRYALTAVRLGPRARLVGSGPATVLEPAARAAPWALVTTRGRGARLEDLSIDGAGRAERAVSVGPGSRHVRLQGVRIRGVRDSGVWLWGPHHDVSVQDGLIEGSGAVNAGVFDVGSDRSSNVSVVRTTIRDFRGYGVLFAHRFYRRPAAALHNLALDNRISDIEDPSRSDGTSEGGIWSGGVEAAIIGNHTRRTGIDGIETVGSSSRTTIVANDVEQTPVGIYVERATHGSLIARNRIAEVRIGINVEWEHSGAGSAANTFAGNRIQRAARTGLFVDVGSDGNRIERNVFVRSGTPAIVLQGASENLVVSNRMCSRVGDGAVVAQQSGRREDGSLATARGNRLARNDDSGSCGP
jgi:hypothetical protein